MGLPVTYQADQPQVTCPTRI